MTPIELKRLSRFLPAAIIAAVVLLAGARLITLSMRDHALQLRTAAQSAVAREARLIEAQLQTLYDRTAAEARRAAGAPAVAANSIARVTPGPGRGAFWMSAAGTVLRAGDADADVGRALAQDWAMDPGARATAGIFGPVRYRSQWMIAVYAPTGAGARKTAPTPAAWAVGYESLDALLTRARIERVVKDGYELAIRQSDPLTHHVRQLFGSRPDMPTDMVSSPIPAPAALAPLPSAPYLELAVRPRAGGWYPVVALATEIGVLLLLAWAFAFSAQELIDSLGRAQSALTAVRQRLHAVNQRLFAEIERHQELQRSLEHARYHDPFTGLPNRRYFMDQLDRALREVRTRSRQRIALVLIEIDRFKLINDTLGHTAGDELMLQVAQRFTRALTGLECVLAHLEGGQLALLLLDVHSADAAQAIAGKLLSVRQEPFTLRQHRISVAPRIGLSCVDSGLQRTEEALREVDIALSLAKQQNPPLVAYNAGMGGAAVSLVSLEADLHIALDRRQFRLLFQPIVDLRARRVVGVESLLRWRHPVEGLLTPEKFLSIAEEAGVTVSVTRWIIQRVCRLAAEWRQRLPQATDFYLSVNLSAAALRDPGLRDYVAQVLHDTHVAPRHLKFELTEVGLISNVGAARELLTGLHNMGIELMLDDFGTGYSSLSYLQLFPFNYVKIDRPLSSWTGSDRSNNAITSAILQMTSNLGLRAVAEVVETRAAAQALLQMGCDFGQGYFFCEPVEAEEALHQLRTYNGPPAAIPVVRAAGQGGAAEVAGDYSPTLVLPAQMTEEGSTNDDTLAFAERKPRWS